MSQTFEDVWRLARLEMPAVPSLLVRAWAQEAYTKLCDRWGWSFLRAEGTLTFNAARTLTGTFGQGSTTVTSAGAFLAADVGRQIRTGRQPIYTIRTVTDANTVTLDRAYTEESTTTAATIQDCYASVPADFRRFDVIYDRYYLRTIPFWIDEQQLAAADPGRVVSDSGVRYLVARKYSTSGAVQYEAWPAPTAFRTYPFLYYRKAEQLANADLLPGVISERADLLKTYCLSRGALWPGDRNAPNPFFAPPVAALFRQEWTSELENLVLRDDDEYPQQLLTIQWARRMGAIAPTAALLRQSDATINDYY